MRFLEWKRRRRQRHQALMNCVTPRRGLMSRRRTKENTDAQISRRGE
jgi:hypothetical protein